MSDLRLWWVRSGWGLKDGGDGGLGRLGQGWFREGGLVTRLG